MIPVPEEAIFSNGCPPNCQQSLAGYIAENIDLDTIDDTIDTIEKGGAVGAMLRGGTKFMTGVGSGLLAADIGAGIVYTLGPARALAIEGALEFGVGVLMLMAKSQGRGLDGDESEYKLKKSSNYRQKFQEAMQRMIRYLKSPMDMMWITW